MNAREVVRALGGQWFGTYGIARCPTHDDRQPSLSVRDGDRGRLLVHCFAGCDGLVALATLRSQGFRCSTTRITGSDGLSDQERDRQRKISAAARIWASSKEPRGTVVERYLRSRGLQLPRCSDLRYCRACLDVVTERYRPAMIALVRNPDTLEPTGGIHRTYLRRDGRGKASMAQPKMALGPTRGGAVMLAPAGSMLLVGEGIETTLAGMQASELPGWAALSTSGLLALSLPGFVRSAILLADNDESGAGERAARMVAQRWLRDGLKVWIALPPLPGTDFNDVLQGGSRSSRREARRAG